MSSNTDPAEFRIRQASPDDVDDILYLIKELAIYEKAADHVVNTSELIRKNLFETPYAHVLLAFGGPEPSAVVAGLAINFFSYSTWTGRPSLYLEDLFVLPEYRKIGIGKAFFGHLGKIAQEKGCGRMDWSVLKWNQPSIDFYEKRLGATAMHEWVGMRLEEAGVEKLKEFI